VSRGDERPRYTFGDTPLAVRRLQLLAQVFEAPSRSFLDDAVTEPPRVAVDLGCGPGVSTRLLAEATAAEETLGLDTSPAFLEVAARDAPTGVAFEQHDATELPLPRAPVDLIYCRLLLAHIAAVETTVQGLASQLTARGLLLVDEMEWIDAPFPALEAYERVVVDLVGSRGAPMYAGPIVNALRDGDGWEQRSSRVRVVPIAAADAARLYRMNLETWRDDPHIRERYDRGDVDQLAGDLDALIEAPDTGEITWGVRQVVFARTPSP
jgi:trans-aconitate 2-methyltransferase